MSQEDKNLFSIYLESYQKYLVFHHIQPVSQDFVGVHKEYGAVMVHEQDKSFDIGDEVSHQKTNMIELWLKYDKKIDIKEKAEIIKILKELDGLSYLMPSLFMAKTFNDSTVIKVSNIEAVDNMLSTIALYNEKVEIIKEFFKKNSHHRIAFYHEINAPASDGWNIFYSNKPSTGRKIDFTKLQFIDNDDRNVKISQLIPKKIEIKKPIQDLLEYIKNNDSTIVRKSYEDDKKAGAEMFVVHSVSNTGQKREGFLGKDSYYGPLNTAELFYDSAKAIRSAKARGVKNMQVWRVNLKFKKSSYTSENFPETGVMNSIIAIQEQELIEEMLKTEDYKKLERENSALKKILEENNLLPASLIEAPAPLKKNKI